MNCLTMNIYINAWLDCNNPYISIQNRFNDEVLAYFDADAVKQLMDNGDICIDDLQSTDKTVRMQLITELLTLKAKQAATAPVTIKGRAFKFYKQPAKEEVASHKQSYASDLMPFSDFHLV